MINHSSISDLELHGRIRRKELRYGGNKKLKLYGTLQCSSGKRMKRKNRVFFATTEEAREQGYRPCGHCMREDYKTWRNGVILD